MSIPKIIHYCWLSNDTIPEDMQKYIDGWHRLLPDYRFIKWDFNRFEKSSSVWVSEAFDNKKYAFAADYIRLYAIYHYGGIYMDMDIEVLKAFDDLLDKEYMFACERPDKNWIEAGCFGAKAGNEFLKLCLEYYKDRHFVSSNGSFDTLPLPRVMNNVIVNNNIRLDLYDWKYFTCKSFETGIESPEERSYAIHHFAGSWKSKQEQRSIEIGQKIRQSIPVAGNAIAFIYEKSCKVIFVLKEEGIKGVFHKAQRYIDR